MTGEAVHADGLPVREAAGGDADSVPEAGAVLEGADAEAEAPAGTAAETVDGAGAAEQAPDETAGDGAQDALAARFDLRLEEAQRLLARQTDHVELLHAENQRLRQGELRAALLPLVRDLLRVQDDLARLAGVGDSAAGDLEIARQSILDALARNGIVAATPAAGDPFDPRLHRAEGPVQIDDPARHRTVAEVLRSGFAWEDGTVVRAADVLVFTHVPAAEPAPTTTT